MKLPIPVPLALALLLLPRFASASASASPTAWTNTCGPPCDDLCMCDSRGRINCHGNPWFCYQTCCQPAT